MKTKTFLLVFLFTGLGLIRLSAQNGKNGTGAINGFFEWDGYKQPVYCDGEIVDYLTGTVSLHSVAIFKDNVVLTYNQHLFGEVYSTVTDEIFRLNEIDKCDETSMLDPFHFNLIGNKGSHYIGFYIWDMANDPEMLNFIYVKGVFPGNDK
jgi:hypothetical protein